MFLRSKSTALRMAVVAALAVVSLMTLPGPSAIAEGSNAFSVTTLSDGVHLLEPVDPGLNRVSRTNSLVVEQSGGLVVVGAQPSESAARELQTSIAAKFDAPIRYLVLTNPTLASSGGATAFPAQVLTLASSDYNSAIEDPTFDVGAEIRTASGKGPDWKAPRLRAPAIHFRGQTIVDDAVHPVVLELTAPAYSPGSLVVRLPKDNILYLGPILFEPGTAPYAHVADIGAWITTLNKLVSRRVDGCIPRLGGPSTRDAMQKNRDAFAWLRGNLQAALMKRVLVADIPQYILGAEGIDEHFGRADPELLNILIGRALEEELRERRKRNIPTP